MILNPSPAPDPRTDRSRLGCSRENPSPLSRERTDQLMLLALEQARLAAQKGEVPVGAILADRRGAVLAKAYNQPIDTNDPTAHAEILVLRKAGKAIKNYRLPGTILITTLEPCIMCLGALFQARIDGLIFGTTDPKSGALVSCLTFPDDFPWANHKFWFQSNVRAREAADLLKEFFQKRRQARTATDPSGQ